MSRVRSAVLGVGLACVAIGGAALTAVGHPALADHAVLVGDAGLVFAGIGCLLVVAAAIWMVAHALSPLQRELAGEISTGVLHNRVLRASELSDIVRMGRSFISDAHPSDDVLRARMRRNPEIVRVVTDRSGKRERFMGYTIIYPLTANGVEQIENGTLRTVKDLRAQQIARTPGETAGLYVSMVCGHGRTARATALAVLRSQIRAALAENSGIGVVFARPATKEGLRLLRKFEFNPLAGDDSIWAARGRGLDTHRLRESLGDRLVVNA